MAAFCLFAKVPFWKAKPNHYATFKIQASCKNPTRLDYFWQRSSPRLLPQRQKMAKGNMCSPSLKTCFQDRCILIFLAYVVDDLWYNVVDKWNSLQNSQLQRCLFPKPNYIYVTIVSIVLFRLINISLIASSFQPRLDRLGQISWLSLLADHQSLTSRRRTSSQLLLFWLSTLKGSFVLKLLASVSPGCRARLATCRSWSPTSREKAGSLWQRGKLRCMPYLNLSHTWR